MSVEVLSSNEVIADLYYAPAAEESSAIAIDYIFSQVLNKYRWVTPAIVNEYDREKNIVTITPAIKESTTDQSVELCKMEVPCVVMGGGGWVSSYPLKKDNTGWLFTNDKDISLFLKSKKISEANTLRKHDFADSIFVPDVISDFKYDKKEDEKSVVFQNIKGEIKAAIDDESLRIKFKDKTKIKVDKQSIELQTEEKTDVLIEQKAITIKTEKATIVINDEGVSIKAEKDIKAEAEKINLKGEVTIDGTLKVTKDATFDANVSISGSENVSGSIDASGDVTGSGISLSGHTHGGVESGSSNTGAPQ